MSILPEAPAAERVIAAGRTGPGLPFEHFARDEIEQSIPARFEKQVARTPGGLAVEAGGQSLTYEALNRAANRVARAIVARCGDAQAVVALHMTTPVVPVAGVLGVLKAGTIVLSLDPATPPARNRVQLEDAGAALVLTDGPTASRQARDLAGRVPIVDLAELAAPLAEEDLGGPIAPQAPAWIIYTSGSTGRPKGVIHTHRSLLRAAQDQINSTCMRAGDRKALLSRCGHEMWVSDILMTLLNGATTLPFDVQAEGIPRLAAWLARERITIYRSVPTTFRLLMSALPDGVVLDTVRLVILAGEPIRVADLESFKRHFPVGSFFRAGYGITECPSIARCWLDHATPTMPGGIVPAGHVIDDIDVLLLDERGQPVGPGQVGEIAVRSAYLPSGYWRQPALTAAQFLPDATDPARRIYLTGDIGHVLPDGRLVHLGRRDGQVKVRGHRVELGEVEDALLGQPGIQEAVVVARADADEPRLVAYVVPSPGAAPTVSALRRGLARTLPASMLPSAIVRLSRMPLTETGKVDRGALPDPGASRPELDTPLGAPRTPIEATLAGIWATALGLDSVGVDDPYLELGGDSLQATRIAARVMDQFGLGAPIPTLLEASTVAEMAVLVTEHLLGQASPDLVRRVLDSLEAEGGSS